MYRKNLNELRKCEISFGYEIKPHSAKPHPSEQCGCRLICASKPAPLQHTNSTLTYPALAAPPPWKEPSRRETIHISSSCLSPLYEEFADISAGVSVETYKAVSEITKEAGKTVTKEERVEIIEKGQWRVERKD